MRTHATSLSLFRRHVVALVRHAARSPAGQHPSHGALSPDGIQQCLQARSPAGWIARLAQGHGLGARPLIVSSSAPRCVETSERLFAPSREARENPAHPLAPRVVARDALRCDAVEDALADARVRDQLLVPGTGARRLRDVYEGVYVPRAIEAIALAAGDEPASSSGRVLVVCGDAIALNAIGLELAAALDLSDADRDVALDTELREADGFLVTPDGVAILSELSDESEDMHV